MNPATIIQDGETYLGDGLYTSFDGYHVVLRAPRHDGDHVVMLETEVLGRFLAYVVALDAERNKLIKERNADVSRRICRPFNPEDKWLHETQTGGEHHDQQTDK
jgi:hypothetical protein